VVGLQYAILMCPEFLQLGLEQLRFLVGDGLLIEDEHIADVVVVNL